MFVQIVDERRENIRQNMFHSSVKNEIKAFYLEFRNEINIKFETFESQNRR